MNHFCYLCFVSRLFIAALWLPAWKRANLLDLLFGMFSCVSGAFPCDVLCQVWYLIVSFPDIYLLFTVI